MPALPRPPVLACRPAGARRRRRDRDRAPVALALSLGRDPNLETTFALVPVPVARILLELADSYSLTGLRRLAALCAGILASVGWWVLGLLAAAWIAALSASWPATPRRVLRLLPPHRGRMGQPPPRRRDRPAREGDGREEADGLSARGAQRPAQGLASAEDPATAATRRHGPRRRFFGRSETLVRREDLDGGPQ